MYPLNELTPEQKDIYNTIRGRIDPTYSVDALLRKFRKQELRELVEQAEKLPPGLFNSHKGLVRRLYRINMALARKGGLRGYKENEEDNVEGEED